MRRAGLIFVVTLALLIAPMQASLLALGDITVTLTCSNGTEIMDTILVVNSEALAALQSAVDAMTLYPAGLVCRITQQLIGSLGGFFGPRVAFAQGNPTWNYAVGGGQAKLVKECSENTTGVQTNFGFSARVHPGFTSNGVTGEGMFEITVPHECTVNGTTFRGSHLSATVDCLNVTTTSTANLRAKVVKATGAFAVVFPDLTGGPHIAVQVTDSGIPGGTGDMIGFITATESACGNDAIATDTVDNGNISVHQAGIF